MNKQAVRRVRRKIKADKKIIRAKAPKKMPDRLVQRLANHNYVWSQRDPKNPASRNGWIKRKRPAPFTPPKLPS